MADDNEDPFAAGRVVAKPDPEIQAGHVLAVEVVIDGAQEVSEPGRRVTATGQVSLPLVGTVDVAGLTIDELRAVLNKRYSEFFKSPLVDVNFGVDSDPGAVSPWGTVTILGQVKLPGRINIPPTQDLTLSMGIQLAGGFAESAKEASIRVSRRTSGGKIVSKSFNLRAAAQGEVLHDVRLEDGDVIFVPEKVF